MLRLPPQEGFQNAPLKSPLRDPPACHWTAGLSKSIAHIKNATLQLPIKFKSVRMSWHEVSRMSWHLTAEAACTALLLIRSAADRFADFAGGVVGSGFLRGAFGCAGIFLTDANLHAECARMPGPVLRQEGI
jgi:hypothetical protein